MNGVQGRKLQRIDKPIPGCLGRMVNLFDLSAGISGNKLLTDKPHQDRLSLSRSTADTTSMSAPPFGHKVEDKMVTSEMRRIASNKANGTPMKKLIAQEMSKEVGCKQSPTNVVAKLMGLDTAPQQQPDLFTQKGNFRSYSRCSSSEAEISKEDSEHDCDSMNENMQSATCWYQDHSGYKDVYEVWQQPSNANNARDRSPGKGRCDESLCERRMALVRYKFMEAKRLATNEKLQRSQEFQDAVEVLSSNRDLFLQYLQESNSSFSENLYDFQSMMSLPETRRITVLRPSKLVAKESAVVPRTTNDKRKSPAAAHGTRWDRSNQKYSHLFPNQRVEEHPTQPTRIVVLKPSPGKAHDIKAVVSSYPSSSRIQHDGMFESEDIEARETREVAKEITRQMRDNLMGHRRDEIYLSSVYSNGYTGDDSSFNKSEDESIVDNLSDSEILSPTSGQSWDCSYRYGSPYSFSTYNRPFSHESSVCKEAKKRLSERWALMASNARFREQKHSRKSSSTLGEMLALSDVRSVRLQEVNNEKEQEARASTSCLTSNTNKEGTSDSPTILPRSKSLPISSTAYSEQLDVKMPATQATKPELPTELAKPNMTKSFLKGKVSSLFFSKNKKSIKEKSDRSLSEAEFRRSTTELPCSPGISPEKTSDSPSLFANDGVLGDCSSPDHSQPARKVVLQDIIGSGQKQGLVSQEVGASVSKPMLQGTDGENQDQPSPISVLQPPFEDDCTVADPSRLIKPGLQGAEVPSKSNLIGKSPPIGTIARTLSWDESCTDTATHYPCTEEDQDWQGLVHALLSAAELDGEVESDSILAKWHSPDTPLNPSLRDKYANFYDKELIHEARRRQRRSSRKLVFDCVNSLLGEITGYSTDISKDAMSCNGTINRLLHSNKPFTLMDYVWAQMKDWLSGEVWWGEAEDTSSLVVEMIVRQDVAGKWWAENMRMEFDDVGAEIEGKLIEELVEEAVNELTRRA